MRLFIAIDLPKEIKDYLYNFHKQIKGAKVMWVAKKNLHLTLKFLGEVNESQVAQIKKTMRVPQKKIHATLGTCGFFPSEKSPTVLWVSIEPEDAIIQLQQRIDEELLSSFPAEQKFRSHVTLGRIKLVRKKEEFLQSVKEIRVEKIPFTINSFQLIKSELRKYGPTYETLDNVLLP